LSVITSYELHQRRRGSKKLGRGQKVAIF